MSESDRTDEDLAERLLAVEPVMYNHFIEISEGRAAWRGYEDKLDTALVLLFDDEPCSLGRCEPPPPWTVVGNEVAGAWRAANPQHPMPDVGFLNDGGAVAALEEYARLETEAPNCKAMAVARLGRFSRAKS